MSDKSRSRLRLDVWSLVLALTGLICGVFAYFRIADYGSSPLLIVPSTIALWSGITHLFKREAPRN